ncbi:nuclear transport factor 2 family protein [Pseudomonas siliginis]|uniref:nuclear transport factor 2 family protein n=1 Tax=Pseudomonas siliginis TaxID=2842346 RepID=UPI00386F2655
MNGRHNEEFVQDFLQKLSKGDAPALSRLFVENAHWEIAGDTGTLPWLGKQAGKESVVDFVKDTATLLASGRLQIQDITANERRAMILGTLASRADAIGEPTQTSFVLVLEIEKRLITSFRMLEDTFAVSQASRSHQSEIA